MTLKEIIEKYKVLDLSDEEIIKYYFIVNNKEADAASILTELLSNTINERYAFESMLKEYSFYNINILNNDKLSLEERIELLSTANYIVSHGDISEGSLKKVQDIFNSTKEGDITCFPNPVLDFLAKRGVRIPWLDYQWIDEGNFNSDNLVKLANKKFNKNDYLQ